MKFHFKSLKHGRVVKVSTSRNSRRFLNKLALINFENGQVKVYLNVCYGTGKCVTGKIVKFYNDGWYIDKKSLFQALVAFREVQ